jgi:hypothetical protein
VHQEPLVQPRKTRPDIRPGLELVPGEIEPRERWLVELESRGYDRDFPMQNIELDERALAAANFIHARPCASRPLA